MNVRHILYHWASSASNLPSFFNEKSLCVCVHFYVWYRHEHYMACMQRSENKLVCWLLLSLACFRASYSLIHHRSAWMTDAGFMWILGIWAQVFRLARSTLFTESSLPPGYGFSFNISVKSTYIIMCKVIQHITIKKSLQCLEAASATCAQFK